MLAVYLPRQRLEMASASLTLRAERAGTLVVPCNRMQCDAQRSAEQDFTDVVLMYKHEHSNKPMWVAARVCHMYLWDWQQGCVDMLQTWRVQRVCEEWVAVSVLPYIPLDRGCAAEL